MSPMPASRIRLFKPALLGAALALLMAAGGFQGHLNRLRSEEALGLTRVEPLENAPPVLAFTTVALGGFRGLIANVLWIRANDLQQEGKYFEMVQLADWITKLEPHFTQVWLMQSWNMAYNISVKFTDDEDRWRWVQQGIRLLRDEGLVLNPREALLYRELGWFFQHKMGQNMDNAHIYYKARWAEAMEAVLGSGFPDFDAMIQPPDDETARRVRRLREEYKLDPAVMKEVDQEFGPLDWRLPETHAIYWAVVGLQKSRPKDLITLRRVIYQSMALATIRGRLMFLEGADGRRALRLSPNLRLADKADAAYEKMIAEDEEMRFAISQAHKNFLTELVFLCYMNNRPNDATRWLDKVRRLYPGSIPEGLTAAQYARARFYGSMNDMRNDQVRAVIEGLITQSYISLAVGDDDQAAGLLKIANETWNEYKRKTAGQEDRLTLAPMDEIAAAVRKTLLAPGAMEPALAAQLRTRLGIPPPSDPPKPETLPEP